MNIVSVFKIFVLITPVTAANGTPWGAAEEAVIRLQEGKLALCLPGKPTQGTSISSIFISQNNAKTGGRVTVWDIELEKGSVPLYLESGGCISYGTKLSGYKELVAPRPLSAGDTYYSRVNVYVENPVRTSTLFYDAVFCVQEKSPGLFDYLQCQYMSDGSTIVPSCGVGL